MVKSLVNKEKLMVNVLEIVREAKKRKIFTSGDYIFVEAKKSEPNLTIWISSKFISDLVKQGVLIKIKKGNRYEYTANEKIDVVNNKDKYVSIIKKCHQIEENVLQLMQAENDGVKDLSDIVEELNNVVNKLA